MSNSEAKPEIQAVLFDMGGVLVELGDFEKALGLEHIPTEEFWAQWLASPAVRALESGKHSVERFADDMVVEFGCGLSQGEIIEHFIAIPRGLFPGAREMVASVPDDIVTGVLSNTNEIHWDGQQDAEIIKTMCQRHYLSYQLGMTKPDREIFDHVVSDLQVPADRVLFLDDSPKNVEGARDAGLWAELTKGPEAGAVVLQRYEVVSPG